MSRRWTWRRKYGVVIEIRDARHAQEASTILKKHGVSTEEYNEWAGLVRMFGPLGLQRRSLKRKEALA